MKIKGAMTVLTKRAAWYGMSVEWLVNKIDNGTINSFNETIKVLEAYEVYKMDRGFRWSGVNGETWVRN